MSDFNGFDFFDTRYEFLLQENDNLLGSLQFFDDFITESILLVDPCCILIDFFQ